MTLALPSLHGYQWVVSSPIFTQLFGTEGFNTGDTPAYKIVFISAGIGMLLSLVWFAIGRRTLKGIGAPAEGRHRRHFA